MRSREDPNALRLGHSKEGRACERAVREVVFLAKYANLTRNGLSRWLRVAGDHHHADAGSDALGDGGGNLRASGVLDTTCQQEKQS